MDPREATKKRKLGNGPARYQKEKPLTTEMERMTVRGNGTNIG